MIVLWLLTIAAVFAGSVLYGQYQASQYDATAGPYIKKVIPMISEWNPETAKALLSPEVAATIPEENFTEAMAWFSRLGALQSMQEPKFDKVHQEQKTNMGAQTIIVYNVDAKYENGDAVINLNLIERNGAYEIYRFNFSSTALVD